MKTRHTRLTGISLFADPLCLLRSHHYKILNSIRNASIRFLILVGFLSIVATEASATKYYISPSGNDANAGTIGAPFATLNKAWTLVAAGDTVYLRGGTYYFNSEQLLINKNGTATNLIKVWNYPGEAPIIKKGTVTSWVYYAGILVMGDYIHVKGLEITGWKQETADHLYYGFMAQNVQNCTFELLNIHHNGFGLVIGDWSTHYSTNVTVLNCDIHHNSDPYTAYGTNTAWGGADGVRISTVDPNGVFNIIGTRMYWNSDDGVDLYNNNGFLTFTNCWAWMNGYRPGYTSTDPDLTVEGGNGIGFKVGPPVNDYSTVTKRTLKNCLATYNRSIGFDQNLGKVKVALYNNTSCYNARGYGFNYLLELHIAHISQNNISYGNTYSIAPIGQFSPESIIDHCTFIHGGWQSVPNPSFNVTDGDFSSVTMSGLDNPRQTDGSLPVIPFMHLVSGSDLIDAGINVGIPYSGTAPDLGAFEYVASGANLPPVIANQTFSISENSANGTTVGTVVASDPNAGQTLTYSILSGNTSNAFAINSATGVLTVANSTALNYETTPSFALVVKVQDNGTGSLSNQATVTVNLLNLNEAPSVNNQTFAINENSSVGSTVGTVIATDPDAGQTLTYSIQSGNTGSTFTINATTGVILVANNTLLNFESNPTFALVVKAQDNGTGNLSSTATMTINLNDVNETPSIANQSFTIAENSANGTAVGNVVASDPDAGQALTYSILSGNTGGAFAINASTGALSVATSTALNFETTPSFILVVKVQDNGSAPLSNQANITVTLTNVNEVPVIANQTFTIAENSANGTAVGTVVATDPDAGQTLTYSILSGNTNGAFAINSGTGAITVANSTALNFESTPSFVLVVKALDNGTSPLSSQANITVNLTNVNEAPVISNQTFTIAENLANGSAVGTVVAADPDAGQVLTFSILSGNTNGAFTINATSGAITVANSGALNFEVTPSFTLVVKVQDNGTGTLSNQANITITLTDVNDAPIITNQTFSIAENSSNGTAVGTVIASDPDAGQILTYSIFSGNTGGAFSINSGTGVLTVATSSALNFETNPVFSLIVKVQDNGTGSLSNQATITVNLTNVNEVPVIANQSFSVAENTVNSTQVGTIVASDPDAGQVLTYSILSGNTSSAFAVNTSTGVITVANSAALNFESTTSFTLVVKVQDNGTTPLSNQANVTIFITDVNEAPIIANQSFSIAENSANGTAVGTVVASDPDAGQTLSYSIYSGNTNGAFAINASTGAITVATSSALDFETTPSFILVVKVQDNGTASLSNQANVTITLTNVNDAPVISNQTFSIAENSANGTAVGTVIATDPDAGQILTYSILSGNTSGAFAINSASGVLTVANTSALNFETNPTFILVIKVQDNGTGTLSSQANATINLINVNEIPAIGNQSFTIAENSANGTAVGTVLASDPDAGQTLTYSILSGNTNGAFAINAATGALTVANSTVLNFETTPSFILVVKVQDNGTGTLSNQANVTVNLTNTNEVPVIANQTFTIAENSANGVVVGTVIASDPDAGQTLTYSILSGNTSGAFAINTTTGAITVANSTVLNFETNPAFILIVMVQDNGTGTLSNQANITINLSNVNEAPLIANQTFAIVENSSNGTTVGTVVATDPDAGQTLTYSILSGNTSSAFAINATTGAITVANSTVVNFETNPVFTLVVKVQDNGTGSLSNQANITINVADANDPPSIANQSFSIPENSANGTAVGTVIASDPDAGQFIAYSILSGNTNGAFAINSSTGALTVANSAALNYEATPTFTLVVMVQDNGSVSLSNQASITINLTNVNDAPVIGNQSFSVAENSANGTSVGTVIASDPDAGQILAYSILSGNTGNAFAINSSTGVLTVANTSLLDFETTPTLTLVVNVQDNGTVSLSSQGTVTISITNVNEAPLIANQSFSVAENSANGTAVGTVAASDPDAGQTLTYSILSGNTSGAFAINASTGAITVANSTILNFETNPSFTLVVKVQDNGAGTLSNQANVTITLTNVNEIPVIANQSFTIAENSANGTSVGTVVASDPDAGQILTFSILSGNTSGAFAINSTTGAITVANSAAINYETNPSFILVVKVQDNGTGLLSNQANVTISLTNLNEAPIIANQSFTIAENSANGTAVGTVIATDPDAGQSLTYSILSGNTSGAFAINASTGALTVANTNALNFETNPSFILVVKVQDNGTGTLSSQANVTITLTNINEAPIISNQTFSIAENSANGVAVGTVIASDPDAGQTLTYSILSGNTSGAFAINTSTGAITVANSAALNFETTPSFILVVKVLDNGTSPLSSQANITINLTNINEVPIIANQTFTVAENSANGTSVGTVIASDPDAGQTLTYSILSGNTSNAFAINASTGLLTVANSTAINFETNPLFTLVVKVQDNGTGLLSNQANITINVTNTNEAPVIANQSFSTVENSINGTAVGTVVASDPDAGQILTYSILSGNTSSTFAINSTTGAITVANSAALNFESTPSYTLVVKVQDNGTVSLSSQANITITVTDVNEVPQIANQSFTIAENSANGTAVGTVIASDPDAGQILSFSILSGNTNGAFAINASSGAITVANSAALNYEVTPSFVLVVKVQDNGAGTLSNQANIIIILTNTNEAPVIANQAFSIAENSANGTSVGTVIASDPDAGQIITYSILSGNTNGAFAINSLTGAITVANSAALNFESTPSFTLVVKVQDNGTGTLSNQANVTISLTNLNEVPVISNQTFSVAENSANGTAVGTVIASDPDAGQILTYSILSGNTNNAFIINPSSGAISVANSAALNYETTPSFTLVVKVQDNGTGTLSNQANVVINLLNANEAPVITNQAFAVAENSLNGTAVGIVAATDPDAGQSLTYSILSGNTNGAFAINASTGALTVANSGALNFESTPSFILVVEVQDNATSPLSSQANITITLTNVNETPVIANQTFAIAENSPNGTLIGTVLATDPDAGQILTYTILSGNISGAFAINSATGVLSVADSSVLDFETYPTYTLVVKVTDNGTGNLSNQANVIINLTNGNEAPSITNQTFSTLEHQAAGTVVGTVIATDPDAGQVLTFNLVSGNFGNGFSINSSTGEISINNPATVCFEAHSVFSLLVSVQDNMLATSEATITINIQDINESPVCLSQVFSIQENSSNGSAVGTVIATDPDLNQNLSYSILGGNTNNAFVINSSNGQISVNNSSGINYESNPTFILLIQVQDNGLGNLITTSNITINILDINESPIINSQYFNVQEFSVNGTSVGTVIASDPDNGQSINYTILSGNSGNAFNLDPLHGYLTVANSSALITLINPDFSLTVKVADNGTTSLSDTAIIHVHVTQEANIAPVIANQSFSINENSIAGSNVGTVVATDPNTNQSLSYTIVSGNTNGAFSIQLNTGLLEVANSSALDFESVTTFSLLVQVTDNGAGNLSSQAAVAVSLLDVNEQPAISNQNFTIAENSNYGSLVGHVIATDPDAGQQLSYTIISSTNPGAFSIDSLDGEIRVNNPLLLNFETEPVTSMVIKVQDNGTGTLSNQATIIVSLTNVNEAPSIANQLFVVNENSSNGTSVGQVIAVDPDAGQNLQYSILSGNINGAFSIDSNTGNLTVQNSASLNFEIIPVYVLVIKVEDNAAMPLSSQATVTVQLTDINEPPTSGNHIFNVDQFAVAGTLVGTVVAADPDAGQSLAYILNSGNTDNAFEINIATGDITVQNSGALNILVNPVFQLEVIIQDNGTGNLTAVSLVTINVLDVTNTPPIVDDQTFSIEENTSAGSSVGIVIATDPDAGQILHYSILSGNTLNAFSLNSNTGEITVNNSVALDFETQPVFNLVIEVTDDGTGHLSDHGLVTINLIDVNETPSVLQQSFAVNENPVLGTVVGTVLATDPDNGQTLYYSIESGNTNETFVIDSLSGDIAVANTELLDYETTSNFGLIIKVHDNGPGYLYSQITDSIIIQNTNEAPVINDQAFVIAENSANTSSVGLVQAIDPDQGQSISYSIISGNTGNTFEINPVTGELSILNNLLLNYETNPSFALTVKVEDNSPQLLASNAIVTVSLIDLNEAPSASDEEFSINEFSPNGTIVGNVTAIDPDAGQTLSYAITAGNTGNAFQINSVSGQISVSNSNALNYSIQQLFTLTVTVSDNGSNILSDNAAITIHILENPNQSPVLDDQQFSVAENSTNGTIVGTVYATDPDPGQSLTFTIISGNENGAFSIDPGSGELSVLNSSLLNYEVASIQTLVIEVQDDDNSPLSDQGTVTISITDVNEAPSLAGQTISLVENSAAGTYVGTISGNDPDNGQALTYTILSGNTNNAFNLNPVTGILSVGNPDAINFELNQTFTLTVQASDPGNLAATAIVTVNITDLNENPVISAQSFAINENSAGNTYVGTVVASDPDLGQSLTYSIIGGNTAGDFQIDAITGELSSSAGAIIDFEVNPVYYLLIQVTDNGSTTLSGEATITISVNDINENPVITNQSFTVTEFSANGTFVGQVLATDPDAGDVLSYSIISGNQNNAFAINPNTGILVVQNSAAINYSVIPQFLLTIAVTDNGLLSDNALITIQVLPAFNQAPIIYNQNFEIEENSSNGTPVGTIIATDPDPGQTLNYSILSGNIEGAFSIDSNTGLLSVLNSTALDFEVNPVFHLKIEVQDDGTGNLRSQAIITINLLNSNERPIIEDQAFTVAENTPSGTIVGSLIATDPDSGHQLTYTILSGNSDGVFDLDSISGVISVADSALIDFETTPVYNLVVEVMDNDYLTDQALVKISVQDANEPPAILDKYFLVAENAPNGSSVGIIRAVDPDQGQILRYFIVSGNDEQAFAINTFTGELTVTSSQVLDYENNPSFEFMVRVQDNGIHSLSTQSLITVDLINLNEAPQISNSQFDVVEKAAAGTVIGTLFATDPDSGQVIRYRITSGNENSVFILDSISGILSVGNQDLPSYALRPLYTMVVTAADNGEFTLHTAAFIKIRVLQNESSYMVHIDPSNTNDPSEDGSIEHPYNSWEDVNFKNGYTYMQKRGTQFEASHPIVIFGNSKIILDAYGSGDQPVIHSSHPIDIIELNGCDEISINNLVLSSEGEALNCISNLGNGLSSKLSIQNCELSGTYVGFTSSARNSIISIMESKIHNISNTAINCTDFDSFKLNSNQIDNFSPSSSSASLNYGVLLFSSMGDVEITDNTIELNGSNPGSLIQIGGGSYSCKIEGNNLKSSNRTDFELITMNPTTEHVKVQNNRFKGGTTAIHSFAYHTLVAYNLIIQNDWAVRIEKNKLVECYNNTFAGQSQGMINAATGTDANVKNNIFVADDILSEVFTFGGDYKSDHNLFTAEKSSYLNGYSTLSSWRVVSGQDIHSQIATPAFENAEAGDYSLSANSSAINAGCDVGLNSDIEGKSVPQYGVVDLGCYEYDQQLLESETNPSQQNTTVNISVYPNPASDYVNIKVINIPEQFMTVEIIDVNGTVLLHKESIGDSILNFDISHLSSGSYFAIVNVNGVITSKTIIKEY